MGLKGKNTAKLRYMSGFGEFTEPARAIDCCQRAQGPKEDTLFLLFSVGNEFASEALPGALPVGQNNPKVTTIVEGVGPWPRAIMLRSILSLGFTSFAYV